MAGLIVCASASVGFSQDGADGSMIEKASRIFGYNASGRMLQGIKQMGLDVDAGSIVQGAQLAIEGKSVEASPEEKKRLNVILSNTSIKGMKKALDQQGIQLDMNQVLEGVRLAAESKDLGISKEDVESIMISLQTKVQGEMKEKMMAKMKVAGEENKKAGEAFLAKNAEMIGVQKLENGVQYKILKEGTGAKPTPENTVKLHYHGTRVDGTVFDSSVDKGKPITHSASGFVKGFNAAVQAMPVGSKWKVVIPSDLAYGMEGPLGPNQTLIFEIELLEIME